MKYTTDHKYNYEILAAGNVLYGAKGIPNFPVKLANEILSRCLNFSTKSEKLILYDPCCGGGYLLTTLGYLNGDVISTIIGSDIDDHVLEWARKNLSLLTEEGLNIRSRELQKLYDMYQKKSHHKALQYIGDFQSTIKKLKIKTQVFNHDILRPWSPLPSFIADIIITDVPYGNLVQWTLDNGIDNMLEHLKACANNQTIVAIIHDKYQKRRHMDYKRLEKLKVGKRVIEILKLKQQKP